MVMKSGRVSTAYVEINPPIELPITDWKLSKPANDLTYLDWKTATPGRKVPFLRLDDVSAVEILPLPATPAEAGTSG